MHCSRTVQSNIESIVFHSLLNNASFPHFNHHILDRGMLLPVRSVILLKVADELMLLLSA